MSLAGAGNWFVKFDAEADGSVRSMALRRNARAFGREPTGLPRVTAIIVLSRGCGAGYMSIGTADETTGVYFRHEDYAGFWRRLMIDIIDAVVIGVVCLGAFIGLWAFVSSDVILLVCAGMAYCYFVLFKRTKTGTLGYRIGGVKIVGLDGKRARLFPLTLRLLFMALGPLNYFMDLTWLSNDTHRQTLRDKFAHTYVVKTQAQPVGTGKVTYRYCQICGYNFLFREIEIATSATPGR
jgi:uncharacterized RDD family membrane protein YckC